MSKSTAFTAEYLDLIFLNQAIALLGDASGLQPSATAGSLYVSLHAGDPGEGGNQTTNETTYGGYGRVAVARNSGGWTRTGTEVNNTASVLFPTGSTPNPATQSITHFGIGTAASGAGLLLYSGAFDDPLFAGLGIAPEALAGDLSVLED